MSDKSPRLGPARPPVRSLQSSQMSDRSSGADEENASVSYGGDSLSFAMRSANQSFLSVGYRQDNDSDWDDEDGHRSVRSVLSVNSSRRVARPGTANTTARPPRLLRSDGNESLEASLNSLRSSRRSSRRRPDNILDASLHSRGSLRSTGSRAGSRRGTRREQGDRMSNNGSFLSDAGSEDLVTTGFASPLFTLGPGTFLETRSLASSRRSTRHSDDDGTPPLAATSGTFNSSMLDGGDGAGNRRARQTARTVNAKRRERKLTRDAINRKVQVPLQFVTERLAHRQHRINSCRDFFLFIPLLIMFCFFAEYHITNVPRFSLVTQSLRQQYERHGFPSDTTTVEYFRQQQTEDFRPHLRINHYFSDIMSVQFFNDFYVNSILAGTFLDKDGSDAYTASGLLVPGINTSLTGAVDETLGSNNTGPQLLKTLKLLGALRVRTQRVRANTAPIQENLYKGTNANFSRQTWARKVTPSAEATAHTLCGSVMNPLKPSESLYVYRPCKDMKYHPTMRGALGNYDCGGYMFDVPFNINASIARQFTAAALANCSFVSVAASRLAAIEFFTYLPSLDGFTQVKFILEISAGGYSTSRVVMRPFFVYTAVRRGQIGFSAIVLVYLVAYLCVFVYKFAKAIRQKQLTRWALSWWHWIDLGILACGFGALGSFFQWVNASVSVAADIRWPFPPTYPDFLDYVESVYVRWIETCVPTTIFLFVRVMGFMEFWQPLRIIWKTLLRSVTTVCAALIVYGVLLVGYSLSGWAVFGPFSPAFRTIPNALVTLSLFFISDTLYYPIDSVNMQFQFLFFWSYLILVFILTVVALSSIFSHMLSHTVRNFVVGDRGGLMREELHCLASSFRPSSVKRFAASVIGIRHDSELMAKLTQQLHNFNRVHQDFYLFSVREKMEREIDERMREFREHRAGIASVLQSTFVDENDGSRLSSNFGESSLPRNIEDLAASIGLTDGSSASGAMEGESLEVARQMLSTLAQSMSAYMGSSVEASDLGFGALLENSAFSPEAYQQLDESEALQHITEHVQAMYATQLKPNDIEVRYGDWTRVVPVDLYKACGGKEFFMHLWVNDIVPSWNEHLATPAEKERTDFVLHTQVVTRATLATQLNKVKLLDSTLRKLEAHVAVAQDVLDAKNADNRDSSDGEEM